MMGSASALRHREAPPRASPRCSRARPLPQAGQSARASRRRTVSESAFRLRRPRRRSPVSRGRSERACPRLRRRVERRRRRTAPAHRPRLRSPQLRPSRLLLSQLPDPRRRLRRHRHRCRRQLPSSAKGFRLRLDRVTTFRFRRRRPRSPASNRQCRPPDSKSTRPIRLRRRCRPRASCRDLRRRRQRRGPLRRLRLPLGRLLRPRLRLLQPHRLPRFRLRQSLRRASRRPILRPHARSAIYRSTASTPSPIYPSACRQGSPQPRSSRSSPSTKR